jgi:hypothetical protein
MGTPLTQENRRAAFFTLPFATGGQTVLRASSGKRSGKGENGLVKLRVFGLLLSNLSLVLAVGQPATASSDDAWASFRTDVSRACAVEAKKRYADPVVVVDSYGAVSYGVALIYARLAGPKGATPPPGLATVVCIYDKKTKKAELSGEFRTVNP